MQPCAGIESTSVTGEGRYQATTHRPPNQWRGLQRKARVAFCGSNGRWSSGGQGRRSRRVPPKHSGGGACR
ncbi:unnamed protein product [Gadus morhua 'NCC']